MDRGLIVRPPGGFWGMGMAQPEPAEAREDGEQEQDRQEIAHPAAALAIGRA